MTEFSKEGCPAKPARRKEFPRNLDLLYVDGRRPHTSVTRPFGMPPPVTSSSPRIPVGALGSEVRTTFDLTRGIE